MFWLFETTLAVIESNLGNGSKQYNAIYVSVGNKTKNQKVFLYNIDADG